MCCMYRTCNLVDCMSAIWTVRASALMGLPIRDSLARSARKEDSELRDCCVGKSRQPLVFCGSTEDGRICRPLGRWAMREILTLLGNPASLCTIPHFLKFPEKTFSHI